MNTSGTLEDLRVRRTQKLLWEALIELMAQQDFESISVKDICERAMVHRTTFYKHYEDKYDLLLRGMRMMHSELKLTHANDIKESKDPQPYLRMCQHIAENERFYRLMLCGDGIGTFYTMQRSSLAEIASSRLLKAQEQGKTLRAPVPILAQFWAGAVISTIAWWLENAMPYTPEQMARHMDAIMQGQESFAWIYTQA